MAARRTADSGVSRRKLDRLRALEADPAARREYALGLVHGEKDLFVLTAALKALDDGVTEEQRAVLRERYEQLDAHGPKRDPGGHVRMAIVNAFRAAWRSDDAAFFERAATTEEFSLQGGTGQLQAAGLVALDSVDPGRASWHAVRMLAGGGTRCRPSRP